MRIVKIILALAVVAGGAFFAWNWSLGPIKVKRDVRAFAAAMESCTPITQEVSYRLKGQSLTRMVKGKNGKTCRVEIQAAAPDPVFVICDLAQERMPVYADSFRKQNDNIDIFGRMRVTISLSSDDPLFVAMNGPECRTEMFQP